MNIKTWGGRGREGEGGRREGREEGLEEGEEGRGGEGRGPHR